MLEMLTDPATKVQFAGHDTFPLRLLWLKKAYDAVRDGADKGLFQRPDAIARFGVGRNMVFAIKHWAVASQMIEEVEDKFFPTPLGRLLLDDADGLDPYLEDPATAWITHYIFAGTPEQTTTFCYAFNFITQGDFDRAAIVKSLLDLADARKAARATAETIKRDVEVFVRSYISRGASEDAAEPLLAELGLLREGRAAGHLEFVRGPKPTLHDGVFAWALRRYWRRWHSDMPTLSMEQICYGAGSPGRVFKLDEDSVHARLARIGSTTDEALAWTDTAGLRQVIFRHEPDDEAILRKAYQARIRQAA